MIITPDFAYIHQPKTGGSFVTRVLQSLYAGQNNQDPQVPALQNFHKHGTCSDIPATHRNIPILGCIRSPFERYVSQYEFAWWKQELPLWVNLSEVHSSFPHFPELSFEEFVTGSDILLQRFHNTSAVDGKKLGLQTEQFIRFYFHDPSVFEWIDDDYIAENRYEQDMYPVSFLRTGSLNRDLYTYLMQYGFTENELAFIQEAPKERPPWNSNKDVSQDWSKQKTWKEYFTPELKAMVLERERLLFTIFPEFVL